MLLNPSYIQLNGINSIHTLPYINSDSVSDLYTAINKNIMLDIYNNNIELLVDMTHTYNTSTSNG
jgi:hypothetical protein